MRITALVSTLLLLLVAAPAGAERSYGSLEITDGRGMITIKGRGALLGRLDRGSLTITDLSPNDQWSPRVGGIPRGRVVSVRGQDITFYVPGGRYRLVVRGEGINISARGTGTAVLDGQPDPTGATGDYAVGDAEPEPVPAEPTRAPFGVGPAIPPQPVRSVA
jgi:hypothetical protein